MQIKASVLWGKKGNNKQPDVFRHSQLDLQSETAVRNQHHEVSLVFSCSSHWSNGGAKGNRIGSCFTTPPSW